MSALTSDVLIIGAGIFGTVSALEFALRGASVTVLDPGPIPHPLAESTDISKAIRIEYGADEYYMILGEASLEGWQRWNEEWETPLFHQVGVMMVTHTPMSPGGFEYESYQMALRRGHQLDRLSVSEITRRFPAWSSGTYVDGYFHTEGGFAESGKVVTHLVSLGQAHGAVYHPGVTIDHLIESGGRVIGAAARDGSTWHAQHVIVCAGTWTPLIVPELAPEMKSTGHPVFHVKPSDPRPFTPPDLPVFSADISATGWYGFPLHHEAGVVKVANHGVGLRLHPENDPRVVTDEDTARFRAMLADTFPALAAAPITYTRRCVYGDTLDEHFWIDRHPEKPGLTVAAGGSGHAFKFAPILGSMIADAAQGHTSEFLPRFRWRKLSTNTAGEEASRNHA